MIFHSIIGILSKSDKRGSKLQELAANTTLTPHPQKYRVSTGARAADLIPAHTGTPQK